MDAQTTSPNLPGPSPDTAGPSPTNSAANNGIPPAAKKRRASTSGSRGVANLTPEQLAKKRANDREAQRAIRERTRGQIETLERKIQELTSQQPYQDLQHVIRQKELVEAENEDIKRKLNQVLSIIQPLLGENGTPAVEDLALGHRETPGLRLDCNARTTGIPHSGVASMPVLAPHPGTPSLRSATSSSSTYGASPQSLQTPPIQHVPSFAGPNPAPAAAYAMDRNRHNLAQALDPRAPNEKLDVGFILDGRQQQAHDARHQTPLTPSYPHQHTSHPGLPPPTDFPPSYSTPLRHLPPTCPLDGLLLDLLHERRRLASEGLPPTELLGPAYPSFSSLRNPTLPHPPYAHPLSKVFTDIVRTFPDIKNLPEQVAILYIMFLTMRWQIAPTRENYSRLPEWVVPLPAQHLTPHPAWIDNIPWPRMRELMVYRHAEFPFESFFVPYTITVSLNWPYEPQDVLILQGGDGAEGEMAINPVFERHLRDLGNWSLGPRFAKAFPVLAETCRIKGGEGVGGRREEGGGRGWREEIKDVARLNG
ncbi:MAG: hypothetical protein Q9195_003171 [Heterodermia aff. obscurata]